MFLFFVFQLNLVENVQGNACTIHTKPDTLHKVIKILNLD
jgi:hypothetical protein